MSKSSSHSEPFSFFLTHSETMHISLEKPHVLSSRDPEDRPEDPKNVNFLPSTLTASLTDFFFGDSVDAPEDPEGSKYTLFPREFAWF